MTFQEFLEKYNGKFVEVGGSPSALNQCVDLANQYISEVLGLPKILGTNAIDFPKKAGINYDWIANDDISDVPQEGDLIIFSIGSYGHISIFVEGDTKSFRSFDQNYPLSSPAHIQNHTYTSVLGWLRAKITSSPITMTEDEKRALEVLRQFQIEANHGNLEGAVNAAIGAYKDISGLQAKIKSMETQLAELSTQALNLSEANKNLTESLDAKQKELEDWQYKFETANQMLTEQIVKLEASEAQTKFYKKKYQEALISMPKKPSWSDIIQIIKVKLFNL